MPKARGKVVGGVRIAVSKRGKVTASLADRATRAELGMRLHFLEIGPRDSMSTKQIADAYKAACELLDISANYQCFGRNARRAEDSFGRLIEALQAD